MMLFDPSIEPITSQWKASALHDTQQPRVLCSDIAEVGPTFNIFNYGAAWAENLTHASTPQCRAVL